MSGPRRSHLAAAWRLLRAVGHVLHGLWVIRTEFGRLTPDACALLVREWSRQMLGILGVQLVVRGTPPERGPMLLVANHLSWLDILVMHAARLVPAREQQRDGEPARDQVRHHAREAPCRAQRLHPS